MPTKVIEGNAPEGQTPDGPSPDLFYKQALEMFSRALYASAQARILDKAALEEALRWARQAEQIGAVLQNREELPEVNAAYVQLIMHCCLKSQELALISGNLYFAHATLAEVCEQAADSLVTRVRASGKEIPLAVALVVQGYSRDLNSIVKTQQEPRTYWTNATDLDKALECMNQILAHSDKLSNLTEAQYQPFGKKVVLANTAVSNARAMLSRFFSAQLSDWAKAQVMCSRAYLLLARRPITQAGAAQSSGDAHVDAALAAFPAAYAALVNRNYKDSAQHLNTVSDHLNRAAK